MAIDFPDWTRTRFTTDPSDPWQQVLTLGNAELAARLGALTAYDRRGLVLHTQDFHSGWGPWTKDGDGANHAEELSPALSLYGDYRVSLTAGSTDDAWAAIYLYLPLLPAERYGLSAFFAMPFGPNSLDLMVEHRKAGTNYFAGLRYDRPNTRLQVHTGAGTWTTVATGVIILSRDNLYNYAKLVYDISTGYYTRLLFNSLTVDLTPYAIYAPATANPDAAEISIICNGRLGFNDKLYIDAFIFTSTEPPQT